MSGLNTWFWAKKMGAPLFCNSPLLSISKTRSTDHLSMSQTAHVTPLYPSPQLSPASYLYIYLVIQLHHQSPFPMQFSRDANDFDWHVNEYSVLQRQWLSSHWTIHALLLILEDTNSLHWHLDLECNASSLSFTFPFNQLLFGIFYNPSTVSKSRYC